MKMGDKLKALLAKQPFKPGQIATKMGISPQSFYYLKNYKTIDVPTLELLAKALNYHSIDLFLFDLNNASTSKPKLLPSPNEQSNSNNLLAEPTQTPAISPNGILYDLRKENEALKLKVQYQESELTTKDQQIQNLRTQIQGYETLLNISNSTEIQPTK